MVVLRLSLTFLISCAVLLLSEVKPTKGQLRFELEVQRTVNERVVTLLCRDNSINGIANINDVTFWLNRTQPDDPDLRDRSDVFVFQGQTGTELTFILTPSNEGSYTCGVQVDSANVQESEAEMLVALETFQGSFVQKFYARSGSPTTLRCPVQPGALVDNYFGSWDRDGVTLVEVPRPINGIPQDVVISDARYSLDQETFSLVINSVDLTDANDNYRCILNVFNPEAPLAPFFNLNTNRNALSLMVNEDPEILTGPLGVTVAFSADSDDDQPVPAFSCAVAGLPAPSIIWTYIPNLDGRGDELSLSDGENYRVVSNVTEEDSGRFVTMSVVTFRELVVTDGGLVRCRTNSPLTAISADALLTVVGEPDHIDVLISTRGEFIYDVALPVLLQLPVKLNISYIDQARSTISPGRLTTAEFNDTQSILYREVNPGQLPFERYFVRISIVAEFGNRRIEGGTFTSAELVDTTRPSAEVVIFGLTGGVASALFILLLLLPCLTAIGCCAYHRRKTCCSGSCCSSDSDFV